MRASFTFGFVNNAIYGFWAHNSQGSTDRRGDRQPQADVARRLIRRLASGLFTWMPLGLRVLRKVEAVVREEMDRAGALE